MDYWKYGLGFFIVTQINQFSADKIYLIGIILPEIPEP
jgi:hypothetical protein